MYTCLKSVSCLGFMDFIYSISIQDQCLNSLNAQNVLQFTSFWVLFFAVILLKVFQDNTDSRLRMKHATHGDFTIVVRNLPLVKCSEQLKEYLQTNLIADTFIPIVNVNRVFKIAEYHMFIQKKIEALNKYENLKLREKETRLLMEEVQAKKHPS